MAADDIRREEGIGLAEHAGFGFNATDTPGDDADTIDHRCMRVGAKDGVGEPHAVFFPDAARQVFHVDLVNDAVAGRDDADGFKRALRPFDEAITLGVAREFDFLIALHGIGPVVDVDLDIHFYFERIQIGNIFVINVKFEILFNHGFCMLFLFKS